jgi:prokaryotic ubiquitin-like protein Pup
MAAQEHQHHTSEDREFDDAPPAPAPVAAAAQARDHEVDLLLDEIDSVLETNAESFVRGFVQKGGQ